MFNWIGKNIHHLETTFSGDVVFEGKTTHTGGNDFTFDGVSLSAIQTSSESFSNDDVSIMTSAAIEDKILSYGYSTTAGDITGVTAGTGLSGGGADGSVTLNVSGLTVSEFAGSAIQTGSESFVDNDTSLMTSAAIQDKIEAYSYATAGDNTSITTLTNTSLILARDADNNIDFTTDNAISFKANGDQQILLENGLLKPHTDGGIKLGDGDYRFGEIHCESINNGAWQGSAITSAYTKHVLHYSFRGYAAGLSSGNWQYAEDFTDPQFPVQLNSDYGNTAIASGSLTDVSTWFRSSGIVMPRAATAISMFGWATCGGTTNNISIAICKITPTRNSTGAKTPVVVATITFAALNSNDKMEDFEQTSMTTAAIAKGDILMPFIISPYDSTAKTTYFNVTLEVEG